ncbi:MAG: flavin reductase family protein [Acidimicrobiia bacterium]
MSTGFDSEAFRRVMGGFATGVSVVTAASTAGVFGITVNSLTSVSLEPVWLSIGLTPDRPVTAAIEETGRFVVNLLDESQEQLARHFAARKHSSGFSNVAHQMSDSGVPVLKSGLGYLQCEVVRIDDGGDHRTFVAHAVDGESREGKPLLYFRGRYRSLQ